MQRVSLEPHRRSIRLKGFDYSSPAAYYVTICTREKQCLFGEIIRDQMRMNEYGRKIHEEWWRSEKVRPGIKLDAWVVMPNHVHGVVMMLEPAPVGAHVGAPLQRRPRSLSSFVAQFKASAARRINALRGTPGATIWQRNYYEHIVRSEDELNRIREYITTNPLRWASDPENPFAQSPTCDEFEGS